MLATCRVAAASSLSRAATTRCSSSNSAASVLLVAGDFNDWGERLDVPMRERCGLQRAKAPAGAIDQRLTFPSRVPVFALDRVYLRGLRCLNTMVPRGTAWARMSDHLPLLADLEPV